MAVINYRRNLAGTRPFSSYLPLSMPLASLSLSLLPLIVASSLILLPLSARALTAPKHGATAQDSEAASQLSEAGLTRANKTSPAARALANKILGALGGFDNFKEFNDLPCRAKGRIVQTSSISNVVNTFDCEIVVMREKQRITMKFLGQPLTTVYDGKQCWTEQGDSILPSDKETARRIEEDIQHGFLLLESIKDPAEGGPGHEAKGKAAAIMQVGKDEAIDGKQCNALVIWAEDGLPTTFYADKDTHIILASSYPGMDLEQGSKIEKIYHYLDYRPICKTIQPFKVVEFSGSKKASETIIDSVDVDNTITDASFVMPKEIVPARLLAGPVTVPFDYSSNEIIIHATINGTKDLSFIVDTGATQCIIDKVIAGQIGTPTVSNLKMTTGAGSIQTEALSVDKLSIGDLQLTNVPFATADLSKFNPEPSARPSGLIGANVLKRFLMTIDYENQKLTFADPTKVVLAADAIAVSTTPSLGMAGVAVEGNLDGKQKVNFLIDTGAAFNNIAESKIRSIISGPLYKIGVIKGLDGQKVQTASARFNYLDLDGLRIDKPVFSIAPQSLSGEIPAGIIHSKDLAILGNPTLCHYTVTFDYRGQRLIFSQSKSQKAATEFGNKLDAIKLEWLKSNNANPAVRELSSLADLAHNRDLPAMEALVRCQLALALCQKNGGSFTPNRLFDPIRPEELLAENSDGGGRGDKPTAAEKLFGDAEAQLLTAFNLSERCTDKTIQGRVLAAWGLMYASQDREIHYLSSAKQKLSKAVALAPSDADVLAASGYFLSRLDSFKPKTQADAPKISSNSAQHHAAVETAKSKKRSQRPPSEEKSSSESTAAPIKNVIESSKWLLVDQIIDQAITIDPGNWLALWTKYERVKSQDKSDDMKLLVAQLKHYFPTITLTTYLR